MKQFDSALSVLLDEQRGVSLAFMVRGLPTTPLVPKNGAIVACAIDPRNRGSGNVVADSVLDASKTLFFAGYGRAIYGDVTLGLF